MYYFRKNLRLSFFGAVLAAFSFFGLSFLPISAATNTLGITTIGATPDSADSNYINATRFTMPNETGTATSMSVYIAAPIGTSPNNQYSMAIYADSAGVPGTLVASTANGTLTGNAWNTLAITATLSPNTTYWLGYNTNGAASAQNNLVGSTGSTGQTKWRVQTFGTWPTTFGAVAGSSSFAASIYVTYTTSVVATDTTPPTTPSGLSATAVSTSGINLSWTASTDAVGVTGYKIYRGGVQIGTSATNSYSDTGLAASTLYSYTVSAYDAAGNNSAPSGSASATTQSPVDTTAPTLSFISASSLTTSGATITWTTNESSDTQVEYGQTTSYGNTTTLNTSLVTTHSQSLTSLSAGTTYHYRVKSKDAAGNLATSLDNTFTTTPAPDTTAPNTITTLAITSGSVTQTSATLTFTAPADLPGGGSVTSYNLRYATTPITTGNWASATQATGEPTPATPGTTQSYILAGLTPATTYYVALVSTDAAGNTSALSNSATLTTVTPLPPADTTPPVISGVATSSLTTTSVTIGWTTNESSDTQVEYGLTTSYGNTTTLNTTLVTVHAQTLTSLTPGTLYHYRVKSKDAAGNSAVSGDNTFTTSLAPDTTAPSIPSALTATALSTTQITLSWGASTDPVVAGQITSGVSSYRVERCTGVGCSTFTQIGTTANPSYADTALSPATTYTYRVRVSDGAGNLSSYSTSANATTQALPPPVDTTAPTISGIVPSGTANSTTITWTTNEISDSLLKWGRSPSVLTTVASSSNMLTSHALSVSNLNRRTTYYYQVVSVDAAGNSANSTVGSLKTGNGKTSPIRSLQAASGSVILSWAKPDDEFANRVEIYRSTGGYPGTTTSSLLTTITDINQTTYHDSAVSNGVTYYYSLYVIDDLGIYSDAAQVSFTPQAPVTPPASGGGGGGSSGGGGGGGGGSAPSVTPPSDVVAIGAPDQIIITWKNPKDSTFVRTRIVRKANSAPVSANDGEVVYEGDKEQFTDTKNLIQGTTYYYGVFSLDQSLTPSQTKVIQAKMGDKTEAQAIAAIAQAIQTANANGATTLIIITKDLKTGARDGQVKLLQEFLKSKGFLPSNHESTDFFGVLTTGAVISFQKANGISPAVGFVGPLTRGVIMKVQDGTNTTPTTPTTPATPSGTITRVLVIGMSGSDVKLLQDMLKAKGYFPATEESTGYFGQKTEKAIKDFQCAKLQICSGNQVTTGWGQVGRMTREAM